jgi:hypothetical protein
MKLSQAVPLNAYIYSAVIELAEKNESVFTLGNNFYQ